jgi:hypothetical protein
MSERKLKLIKNKQPQVGRTNKVNKRPYRKPDLTGYSFKDGDQITQISSTQPEVDPVSAEMPEQELEISNPSVEFDDPQSAITPAEAAEVARFKALTAARAAQQAMIERIMAELDDLDAIPPAA